MMTRFAVFAVVLLASTALACERGTLAGRVQLCPRRRHSRTKEHADPPSGLAAPEWNEPGDTEAREAMIELVNGRTVRCELDGTRTYDRCVGTCFLDAGASPRRS